MKKVSVIVPVYNVRPFLKECINSIVTQTYKNIEIILVDDGSNDGSNVLCEEIAKEDDRIKVFHNTNHGVSYTRNYGIKKSTGEYILPVDGDDIISAKYIEKAVDILEKDEKIGIVYCEAEFFGERNGRWNLPEFTLQRMLLNNVIFVSALFRKIDWERVGGYSEELVSGIEDYDFWLSILELRRSVCRIPEVLFYYRIRENSRSKNFDVDKEKTLAMYQVIHKRHKQLYIDNYEIFTDIIRRTLADESSKIKKIKMMIPFAQLLERYPSIKSTIKRLVLGSE